MNKIAEILKTNKYVIIWTIAYIAIVWAILLFMFNFNIFVGHQWQLLMHAELKGFAGFVFGILVLATLPMYIATTAVIIRTNKPLITVNISPIIKVFNAIIPHPVPANASESVPQAEQAPQITDTITPTTSADDVFPTTMPSELRGAFIRARQHIDRYAQPSTQPTPANIPNITQIDNTASETSELPLPTDFDFDTQSDSDFTPTMSMPTFTDINFGDDDVADDITIESENTFDTTSPDSDIDNSDVVSYLTQQGITPVPYDDMVIAKNMIIATHDDPDFWIADPENWFAAGKQKISPVIQLIKASAKQGLKPVLYLNQTNIMELDTCRTTWENMGVTVITDLDQLPL